MKHKSMSVQRIADLVADRVAERLAERIAEDVVANMTPIIQAVVEMSKQQVDLEARIADLEWMLGMEEEGGPIVTHSEANTN